MSGITRRGFIGGMAALLAAPAIVRASSLMPVRPSTGAANLTLTVDEWAAKYAVPKVKELADKLASDKVALYVSGDPEQWNRRVWVFNTIIRLG